MTRFWGKVQIRTVDGCWPWLAYVHARGYGQFQWRDGEPRRAHRVAWELSYGPIPAGQLVCHKCDNRRCCNPSHLFLGTAKDNTADMVQKGRAPKGPCPGQIPRKLSWEKVREIRRLRNEGVMIKTLAAQFAVHYTMVQNIIHHRSWKEKV